MRGESVRAACARESAGRASAVLGLAASRKLRNRLMRRRGEGEEAEEGGACLYGEVGSSNCVRLGCGGGR